MFRNKFVRLALLMLACSPCFAQVVSPWEIKDPELSSLQHQYIEELQAAGRDILAIHFDYPFYLSRKLDLDQVAQQRADQRSIRFDNYDGHPVLAITGNYYAAYSTEKMSVDQRARATFLAVVVPILKGTVPRFQSNHDVHGYAIEISHHITGTVMGVGMEHAENLMVYLPQREAIRLIGSKSETVQQAALLEGKAFLNAQPITLWLSDDGPRLAADRAASRASEAKDSPAEVGSEASQGDSPVVRSDASQPAPGTIIKQQEAPVPPPPPRDTSPQALAALQTSGQEIISRLVKEMDSQAHFVGYAPPRFIGFRQGIYLELSLNTELPEPPSASRYRLAALAFDEHISHLLRPTLEYFKGEQNFDGVGYSTTVHLSGKSASANSEAVEFFFPLSALRCYASYDCTGQQLIDEGTVLINGERVALDLQIAEGGSAR